MLAVFYCNSKVCLQIHIRTDERQPDEHELCPKCGEKLMFISDFHSWTSYDKGKRREIRQMFSTQEELKSENEKLKLIAENYRRSYIMWKQKGTVCHDTLWDLLSCYEPEKYQRS